MGRLGWADKEQDTLLRSFLPSFFKAQRDGKVDAFFTSCYAEWFKIYPVPEYELDRSKVIETVKGKLYRWMYWHAGKDGGARSRAQKVRSIMKQGSSTKGQKRERAPQHVEQYQKMNPEAFRALLKTRTEARLVELGQPSLGANDRMKVQRQVALEMYQNAPYEDKQKVEAAIAEWRAARDGTETKDENEGLTPMEYEKAINILPTGLAEELDAWAEATGWTIFAMACGPKPSAGGALYMQQFFSGPLSPITDKTFQESYPKYRDEIRLPFQKYVTECYDVDGLQRRALPPQEMMKHNESLKTASGASTATTQRIQGDSGDEAPESTVVSEKEIIEENGEYTHLIAPEQSPATGQLENTTIAPDFPLDPVLASHAGSEVTAAVHAPPPTPPTPAVPLRSSSSAIPAALAPVTTAPITQQTEGTIETAPFDPPGGPTSPLAHAIQYLEQNAKCSTLNDTATIPQPPKTLVWPTPEDFSISGARVGAFSLEGSPRGEAPRVRANGGGGEVVEDQPIAPTTPVNGADNSAVQDGAEKREAVLEKNSRPTRKRKVQEAVVAPEENGRGRRQRKQAIFRPQVLSTSSAGQSVKKVKHSFYYVEVSDSEKAD